jgi:hypothetical protein
MFAIRAKLPEPSAWVYWGGHDTGWLSAEDCSKWQILITEVAAQAALVAAHASGETWRVEPHIVAKGDMMPEPDDDEG